MVLVKRGQHLKYRAIAIALTFLTSSCQATFPERSALLTTKGSSQSQFTGLTHDSVSPYPVLKRTGDYKGPVTLKLDPFLRKAAESTKERRALGTSAHNSNSGHARNSDLYFDPAKSSSASGVDPNYGDVLVADADTPYSVSSVKVNDGDTPFSFVGGQLMVTANGSGDAMLARLREKYSVEVVGQEGEFYLIKFDLSNVALSKIAQDLQTINGMNLEPMQELSFSSLNSAKLTAVLADILLNFQDVIAFAEWNQTAAPTTHTSAWMAREAEDPVLTDTTGHRGDGDWWMEALGVKDAWKYSIGTGIKIAVIDNAFEVANHPELERRRDWILSGTVGDTPGNPIVKPGVDGPGSGARDIERYHGSFVSMFACAERNNGIGMAGVAPNATFCPFRTSSTWADINALNYAASKGIRVINVSLVTKYPKIFWIFPDVFTNSRWHASIDAVMRKWPETIIVCGAGNDPRAKVDDYVLQSRRDVIVVGGTEIVRDSSGAYQETKEWRNSSYGDNIDIWAPALGVESAHFRRQNAQNHQTAIANGTSFSGPMVAGAVALLKEKKPNMRVAEAISILRNSANKNITLRADEWGTPNGVPGVGGYVTAPGTNQKALPQVNVTGALQQLLGSSASSARARSNWVGVMNVYTAATNRYYLDENGTVSPDLLLTVPSGTYEQFEGQRVRVTGWERGGKIEVLSIEAAPVTSYRVQGTVIDALGNPVSDLVLAIRFFNNPTTIDTTRTDQNGQYSLNVYSPGEYVISPQGSGYINADIRAVVAGNGTVEVNQNIVVSPSLPQGQTRFVLTWGGTPSDLDSHVTGPTSAGGRFHVYYANGSYSDANSNISLDRDDTDGFGPETITTTVNGSVPGTYRYAVHDYSNRGSTLSQALSNSNATLYVYRGNQLLATIKPQANTVGTVWDVLSMDGVSGNISINNVFSNEATTGYIIQSIGKP